MLPFFAQSLLLEVLEALRTVRNHLPSAKWELETIGQWFGCAH
jgi:hypothetical protein